MDRETWAGKAIFLAYLNLYNDFLSYFNNKSEGAPLVSAVVLHHVWLIRSQNFSFVCYVMSAPGCVLGSSLA